MEHRSNISKMISRRLEGELEASLSEVPVVALLGPRQVGKTTLALQIAARRRSVYLDLESPADRAKLSDPELYLSQHEESLVILDEIQRLPGLFAILRGLADAGRRRGRRSGRFLILGSASIELLKQSSESLAGRIRYVELSTIDAGEIAQDSLDALWLRGGFPDSLLALDDAASLRWRNDFIRTYLERDIPQLGPRIAAETLRRFWTMLAHQQGGLLNAASLARSLSVDGKTIASYIDLLVDLLLVRRLSPWHGNVRKRLVKAPKVYVRDCGLLHALLGIADFESLQGHPVVGVSWETFVLESLLAAAPVSSKAHFFRSAGGAELDLLLQPPGSKKPWAVEIKRSLSPTLARGFYAACETVRPQRKIVVYAGEERFALQRGIEAVPLQQLCAELSAIGG
ncbi:MAG: ATP-binding protein [Leptospirales bacterium]|nr:ATP-binding protein [Leptospirales bacterium]